MFNIFGWRNASKCKKLIKRVQCRLKLLKNKRICIVKQLRKDVAELLKHGHHQTALERVEQVVIDENMVQVYDLLYQFCEFVIINLPYIRNHRDCPNDIKEAVSALIFSSARFGELPELLSLRKLFAGRYGQKFVAAALGLLPGNLVTGQIIENLEMKRVPNDVKYKFLDEISPSCIQTEQLFLEYKPELLENENANGRKAKVLNDQNHVAPQHKLIVRRETERNSQILSEEKKFWRDSCFGLRKDVDCRNEIETCSENSAKLGEEVIYLDDIEEFISPVIKDGSLQDQRLFVFKSFGIASNAKTDHANAINAADHDETESRNSRMLRRKRSRKRSLVQETLNSAYDEFAAYYGESQESSPEIRHKSHHQGGRRVGLGKLGGVNDDGLGQHWPRPRYFSVGDVNGAVEAEQFSSRRHLEKDDAAGRLTLPSRAVTMPCERPRESNATKNINRSNSCPFSQPYEDYSPCRHIHPKLPDYDELATKFMELKRANLAKK